MSKDRKSKSFAPVCHYCKKPGHVMSDCWLLKKRREKEATPDAFGDSVIAQGIEGGCVNVPLHKVNLVSDLVTGSVVVGTRPTLHIKGVSLLLGNDLVGGKVVADPKVTSKPITLVNTEKLEEGIPGILPSCPVTRAMAEKPTNQKIVNNLQMS